MRRIRLLTLPVLLALLGVRTPSEYAADRSSRAVALMEQAGFASVHDAGGMSTGVGR